MKKKGTAKLRLSRETIVALNLESVTGGTVTSGTTSGVIVSIRYSCGESCRCNEVTQELHCV